MKNILRSTLLVTFLTLFLSLPSEAKAKTCHTVYGGTYNGDEVCESGVVDVDKSIWKPEVKKDNQVIFGKFVPTLDSSEYTFKPGEEVLFELVVKNSSDIKLDKIILRDILPLYVEFVSAEGGKVHDRTVEFEEAGLESGKTFTKTIKTKVVDNPPTGITCVTNKAEVYAPEDDSSKTDTTSFCISHGEGDKRVLGATSPEMGTGIPFTAALQVLTLLGLGSVYWIAAKKVLA